MIYMHEEDDIKEIIWYPYGSRIYFSNINPNGPKPSCHVVTDQEAQDYNGLIFYVLNDDFDGEHLKIDIIPNDHPHAAEDTSPGKQ